MNKGERVRIGHGQNTNFRISWHGLRGLHIQHCALVVHFALLTSQHSQNFGHESVASTIFDVNRQRRVVFEIYTDCSRHASIPSEVSRHVFRLVRRHFIAQSLLGDGLQDGRHNKAVSL